MLLVTRRRTVSRSICTTFCYGHFALPTELNPGFALVVELTMVLLVVVTGKVFLEGLLPASLSASLSVWYFWHIYETFCYCLD